MTLSGAVHVYYIGLTLYSILTFILSCIVSIELWVYCHKLCSPKLQRIESKSESKSGTATLPAASPSMQQAISNISGKKTHYLRPNYIFPLLSYLFYLGFCITALMFPSTDENICYWSVIVGTIFYSLGKMWMYLVFVYRLFAVYNDSFFAYSNKILFITAITIILYSSTIITINSITLKYIIVEVHNSNIKVCEGDYTSGLANLTYATVIFDIIISSTCCYLFVRP
eukprot:43696_1